MKNDKNIYLDYAASTPVLPEVVRAMEPFWNESYGNPSSIHSFGQHAKNALEDARSIIAQALNCNESEIYFTASSTESITMALYGLAMLDPQKNHIITSQIEHPATLAACEMLQGMGCEVTYLPVDAQGFVHPEDVEQALTPATAIVSIMYANNEIGTIEPIHKIAQICQKHHVPFHTDASQAIGYLDTNVAALEIDLLTFNGSKIYGPKGVGVLYIKSGLELKPLIPGGGQEQGMRGGTENVPAIVGLADALARIEHDKAHEAERISALRDFFIEELEKLPTFTLTGPKANRLANNIHVCVAGMDGQTLVGLLDGKGIACSSSSACSSADPEPSHVLLAIGKEYHQAFEGVRFSLGKYTTKEDIEYTLRAISDIVGATRK